MIEITINCERQIVCLAKERVRNQTIVKTILCNIYIALKLMSFKPRYSKGALAKL